ncbi:ACT domain-containing protein [Candidatus Methanomassiliicoccus intestinalis]|jgi:amino acid-binding ACT domain protein|uniref:ACT domain-containing protein n=2 Tax=Candidatus Methanomassiliicoccus intestinalis TaxID=1406512 RepID=R9T8A2_METII|nr:ACT domain-containing protein [Candidatus Methanomassiliicoccus intestinalis]AGN25578.1 ACT domain-containing protein [Candidatus Methanomassiliicoccus intestinalis Issoire-Mx1]TQS80703.1 MAG: acetolactate synthase [Candidatus Methanomassiliicoccus intestinalis]TQS81521.1 MAG: acetolactate synthase [Candidatus Methanomassiliicoccus intestinalis]
MYEKYYLKQLSIFSENQPGKLARAAKAMKDAGVNIYAFTIAEGAGYGVIRMLVDNHEAAKTALQNAGFMVAYTDVLALKMEDRPGGLYEVIKSFCKSNINIEYSYAFEGRNGDVLIIRVEDPELAAKKLLDSGMELYDITYFE